MGRGGSREFRRGQSRRRAGQTSTEKRIYKGKQGPDNHNLHSIIANAGSTIVVSDTVSLSHSQDHVHVLCPFVLEPINASEKVIVITIPMPISHKTIPIDRLPKPIPMTISVERFANNEI
jgi:hypothetical protein